jgi:hypothetical protein
MRIMEILLYQPDDPTELQTDADAAMMNRLANMFTRRGLVKALIGSGMRPPDAPLPPELPQQDSTPRCGRWYRRRIARQYGVSISGTLTRDVDGEASRAPLVVKQECDSSRFDCPPDSSNRVRVYGFFFALEVPDRVDRNVRSDRKLILRPAEPSPNRPTLSRGQASPIEAAGQRHDRS